MNDKDWLDRVNLAAEHYVRTVEASAEVIGNFVGWMYSLYGIVLPGERKNNQE